MTVQGMESNRSVLIVHGAAAERLDVAGTTIGSLRKQLKDIFNIPADAEALLNGMTVGDDTILHGGDRLEFVRVAGQKGAHPDFWTQNEFISFFGEANVARMKDAGLCLSPDQHIPIEQAMAWVRWLGNREVSAPKPAPFLVCPEQETCSYRGKTFSCERSLCLVLQCLLDAAGAIRSTSDIKDAYPDEPWEERLDLTIKRKLLKHPSGIGQFVESVSKKGYRIVQ